MTIKDILDELNLENGSNYKLEVLKKYQDNETLKKVLAYAYDTVKYTYGVTMRNVYVPTNEERDPVLTLESAFDVLEKLSKREITGTAAIAVVSDTLAELSEDDAYVFEKILNRDLRINVGRTQINKVFKNLITKTPYMRCGIYSEKTAKKINFPAFVQLKADGTYRTATIENGTVKFEARSGIEYNHPVIAEQMKNLPDGVYVGEMTIAGIDNRAESNGLLNSDNPPHDKTIFDCWDYITLDEYSRPKDKKNKTPYRERFSELRKYLIHAGDNVRVIEWHNVMSIQEALQKVSEWMSRGLEGGILKDYNNIFVDHTSPTQLKLKLEIDADVRITGFIEGTPGTKREKTFGAITFETDDGKVKGRTSGFTDDQLEDFNNRRDELIGKIMTVQFNDLSKARGSDHYALSHPRFIELRDDKNETDTIERIKESREMATSLKG